jgi:hypothetical protein
MNAVREDRTARGVSKLATDTGNVMGQMVTDPNAIRGVQSEGLMDPFSVNALTSGARAQNLNTLGTVSTQLSQNQGSLEEVIQAGANQLYARAEQMKAKAAQATEMAASLQQDRDYNEGVRQFNVSQANKGAGEGAAGASLAALMEKWFPNGPAGTPEGTGAEAQPLQTPFSGEGAKSRGGQWIYKGGKWVPVSGTNMNPLSNQFLENDEWEII